MTDDTAALQERIEGAIILSECGHNPAPLFVHERADRLAAAVLPIVRQAQAEAWEKGYTAGAVDTGLDEQGETPNPYEQEDA